MCRQTEVKLTIKTTVTIDFIKAKLVRQKVSIVKRIQSLMAIQEAVQCPWTRSNLD